MKHYPLAQLKGEIWISRHLGCEDLFGGDTNLNQRRERVRIEIIRRGLGDVVAGKSAAGQQITWAQMFALTYEEPIGSTKRASQLTLLEQQTC